MTVFLITFVAIMVLEVVAKLTWLVSGAPPRTPKSIAMDVAVNVAFLVWATVLLVD